MRTRTHVSVAALLVLASVTIAALWLTREGTHAPLSYRIAYDVEDLPTGVRTTEVLEIDRPLVSRRLLPSRGSATAGTGVYDRTDAGQWRQLAVVGPAEPGQDLQLTAPLTWAASVGLARQDGSGSVAGHACTWWLTREPLDVATFAAATAADRVRSCVDADGRLLADTWRSGGTELRRRTATSVRMGVVVRAFDGATPEPIDPRLVTTAVQELAEPVGELVRPVSPDGAELRAAARVLDAVPGGTDLARRTQRAVYVKGEVVVVLDQIRDFVGAVAPQGDRAVQLGSLGTGQVRATGGGLVLEVRVGDGLVRVRSGLPLEQTAAWLSGLDPVP